MGYLYTFTINRNTVSPGTNVHPVGCAFASLTSSSTYNFISDYNGEIEFFDNDNYFADGITFQRYGLTPTGITKTSGTYDYTVSLGWNGKVGMASEVDKISEEIFTMGTSNPTHCPSIIMLEGTYYPKGYERGQCPMLFELDPSGVNTKYICLHKTTSATQNITNFKTYISGGIKKILRIKSSNVPEIVNASGLTTSTSCPGFAGISPVILYCNSQKTFSECLSGNTTLYNVKVEGPVNSLGYSFSGCTSLVYANLEDCFGNGKLDTTRTFGSCSKLQTVKLPSDLTKIGQYMFQNCTQLSSVTIPSGITTIGAYAFQNCTSLQQVYFEEGSTLTTIETGAFSNTIITSINLPDTITNIGESAFLGCTKLTSVTCNSKNIVVDGFCFSGCTSLTSSDFIKNITKFGNYSFGGCTKLTSIVFNGNSGTGGELTDTSSQYIFKGCTSLSTVTINTCLHIGMFYGCSNLYTVNYGNNVVASCIPSYCFYGTKITTTKIPVSITELHEQAFGNCTSLLWAIIPKDVNNMDQYVFSGCTKLCYIVFMQDVDTFGLTEEDGTLLGDSSSNAFVGISTAVTGYAFTKRGIYESNNDAIPDYFGSLGIPSTGWTRYTLCEGTFASTTGTINSDSSKRWPFWVTDYSVSPQTTASIPLNNINDKVYFPGTAWHFNYAFCNSNLKTFYLAAHINYLTYTTAANIITNKGTFSNSTSLENVTFAIKTQFAIYPYTFHGCSSLREIYLNAYFGYNTATDYTQNLPAFSGCTSLKKITINSTTCNYLPENFFQGIASYGTFYHPKVTNTNTNLYLSGSTYYLGYYHWYDGTALLNDTKDTYTYNITTTGNTTLSRSTDYTTTTSVTIASTATTRTFTVDNGTPSTYLATTASLTTTGVHTIKYTTLISLPNYAFSGITTLETAILSKYTTGLGNLIFSRCTGLQYADISYAPLTNVTTGAGLFLGCTSLRDVVFNSGTTVIPNSAFTNGSFTNLYIPNSVNTIGSYAFYNCKSGDVTIPSGITSVGAWAFAYTYMYNLIFQEGLSNVTFGASSFRYLRNVINLSFPKSLLGIGGSYCFCQCPNLINVSFYNTTSSFTATYTFSGCTKLNNVKLSDEFTSIPEGAFGSCTAIKTLLLPSKMTSLGSYAFSGCTSLERLYIAQTRPPRIGTTPFLSIKTGGILYTLEGGDYSNWFVTGGTAGYLKERTWSQVTPWKLTITNASVYDRLWENFGTNINDIIYKDTDLCYNIGHSGITNNPIGDTLYLGLSNEMEDVVLSGMSSIASIRMGSNASGLCDNAFCEMADLKTFEFAEDSIVTSIGKNTFELCTNLTSITIPDTITSIGDSAFYGCFSLSTVVMPTGITTIGDNAFSSCRDLEGITLPTTLTTIGKDAFFNGGLTSVSWPSSVHNITDSVFAFCGSLTSVTIPSTVTFIDDCAFFSCSSLSSITLPSNIKTISSLSFGFCNSLETINFPSSLNYIENYAFYVCISLITADLSSTNITTLSQGIFEDCISLTTVKLSNKITTIHSFVFNGCSSLTTINYSGTKAQWNSITKVYDWDLGMPTTVSIVCSDGTI